VGFEGAHQPVLAYPNALGVPAEGAVGVENPSELGVDLIIRHPCLGGLPCAGEAQSLGQAELVRRAGELRQAVAVGARDVTAVLARGASVSRLGGGCGAAPVGLVSVSVRLAAGIADLLSVAAVGNVPSVCPSAGLSVFSRQFTDHAAFLRCVRRRCGRGGHGGLLGAALQSTSGGRRSGIACSGLLSRGG